MLVWVGTYLADRRKSQAEARTALRSACADWLTGIAILRHQITDLLNLVRTVPRSSEQHESILKETKVVLDSVKDCVHALHRAYLLDCLLERRESFRLLTKRLEMLYAIVQSQVDHHRSHLEWRRELETARHSLSARETSDEERRAIQTELDSLTEKTEKHDQKCEARTAETLDKLTEQTREIAEDADKMLRLVGGQI